MTDHLWDPAAPPDPEVAAPTRDPELEELHTGDIILEPHDAADPPYTLVQWKLA